MEKLGFKRLRSDEGIYIYTDTKTGSTCIAIVYINDALFCSIDRKLAERLTNAFAKKWGCRDLGDAKEFLCMHITRQAYVVMIDQVAYLEKVLDCIGLTNARHVATPLPSGYYPLPNEDPVDEVLRHQFQTVIGSLMYLMLGTHPDIAFAVMKLSQQAVNPCDEHLDKALHVCHYLVGTKDYCLVFDGISGKGIFAMTDSDWASDPSHRQSQTGYFLLLARASFS
ncbi:unnamed protein product [Peniophora sp. CBMAI 1063]|nr:unnamed protein product [Peniophora sp. CBMAI 1063]